MSLTKNDTAWGLLFNKHNILEKVNENGFVTISASDINKYREARLMTKFDHASNLPSLFQGSSLSILPISRGEYIIAKFKAYKLFEQDDDELHKVTLPENIQSINFEKITSEAAAINAAYVSGIFSDFLGEEELLLPTVSGRMGSGEFSFSINNIQDNSQITLNINKSQIEIDGGYEGIRSLALIEAKNAISTDFLIRQLYYPFRLWRSKVAKEVRPIFLVYSNGIFHLYEYNFTDPEDYNSLVLIQQKHYTLEDKDITLGDIQNAQARAIIIGEPEIPFPQANSFERLINLCELLNQKTELTHDEITTTYDFDKRQTDYYANAGQYLGIIDKHRGNEITYSLTELGLTLFTLNYKQRQIGLVELILSHSVFSETISLYFRNAAPPSEHEVVEIMKGADLYNINAESTFGRRSSTVLKWVDWILGLIE